MLHVGMGSGKREGGGAIDSPLRTKIWVGIARLPRSQVFARKISLDLALLDSFAGLKTISQIDHLRHSLETVNQRLFFMRNKKVSAKVRWEAYYGSFTVSYAI